METVASVSMPAAAMAVIAVFMFLPRQEPIALRSSDCNVAILPKFSTVPRWIQVLQSLFVYAQPCVVRRHSRIPPEAPYPARAICQKFVECFVNIWRNRRHIV